MGIWPWASDNTIIQYNEVSGIRGTFDGQAFDSDDNCRNTLFQFNYSHDNDGGFTLICSVGRQNTDGQVSYVGLENTSIRYNISQNDGNGRDSSLRAETADHPHRRPSQEHLDLQQRFLHGERHQNQFTHDPPCEGWAEGVHFLNNIIIAEGELKYDLGRNTRFEFRKNVFFGNHVAAFVSCEEIDAVVDIAVLEPNLHLAHVLQKMI